MAEKRIDLYVSDDVVQRCDKLMENAFSKFHNYAEEQEILRIQLITTNNEHKRMKTWLDIAYVDIIILKLEHRELTRLYEKLLKNNFVEKFLNYTNDLETLQLKFIVKMNDCKNLKRRLNVVNKNLSCLKSEYCDLIRRYEVLLKKDFAKQFHDYSKHQETLRLKFIKLTDVCERLQTYLNTAYEGISILKSEHDDLIKRYQVLLENSIVEEFLEFVKRQDILQLEDVDSLNWQLTEVDKILNTKQQRCEKMLEIDRGFLSNLSAASRRLLLMYQRRKPLDQVEKKYSTMNKSNQISSNSSDHLNSIAEIDSSSVSMISISESEINTEETILGKDSERDQQLYWYFHEENNESTVVKLEKTYVLPITFADPVNESLELPCSDFGDNDSSAEKCDVTTLSSEMIVEEGDSFVQHEVSSILSQHKVRKRPKRIKKSRSSAKVSHPIETPLQSQFECAICSISYSKKISMIRHMRGHLRNKSMLCEKCGQSFIGKNNGRKLKKCPACELAHRNNRELSNLRCNICDRCFSGEGHLNRHVRMVHNTIKQKPEAQKCPTCDKVFPNKYAVKRHQFSHSSHNLFKCSSCDQCFKYPSDRKRHERKVHERVVRYCCADCDKQCFRKEELIYHIQSQHLPECEKPFKCPICDKSFAFKQTLKYHESVHVSKRPYKCSMCNKQFKDRHATSIHERTVHIRSVPFSCAHCDKKYRFKNGLMLHVRKCHL